MSPVVIAEHRSSVGVITLNRPEVLNAINVEVMERFSDAIAQFGADSSIRCVIITGNGRGFSTGADFSALATGTSEQRDAFMARAHRMMASIEELPKPVLAAVNGVAAGGGFEMMLACDVCYAAASAKIGLTEMRYGFIPGGGGTQRLTRWISPSLAKQLIWSGELLSADQALEYGLVSKVFADGELLPQVEVAARKLAEKSSHALAWAKKLVSTSIEQPLEKGLADERKANVELLTTPEAVQAINKFLKRGNS